jgi:hypothetical protein
MNVLPDGSACFIGSFPLPKDHWLYDENVQPRPLCPDLWPLNYLREKVRAAGRYAVCAATNNGTIQDFDPDAVVQALELALCGAGVPAQILEGE